MDFAHARSAGQPLRESGLRILARTSNSCVPWYLPLGVAVVNDQVDQPKHVGIFDLANDKILENLMIQRRKELADVGRQDVTKAAGEMLRAVHGGVGSLAFSTSIRIGNKATLENRLQDAGQGMMDDVKERNTRSQAPAWERTASEAPASLQCPPRQLSPAVIPNNQEGTSCHALAIDSEKIITRIS